MINTALKITLTVMIAGLLVSAAYAGPISLNETQMDSVTAGGVYKVPAFLCTVNVHGMDGLLNASYHNESVPIGGPITGDDVDGNQVTYITVAPQGKPQNLWVPLQATNTGKPSEGFSAPGQSTYTAIWVDFDKL